MGSYSCFFGSLYGSLVLFLCQILPVSKIVLLTPLAAIFTLFFQWILLGIGASLIEITGKLSAIVLVGIYTAINKTNKKSNKEMNRNQKEQSQKQSKPKRTEPKRTEPKRTEPKRTEAAKIRTNSKPLESMFILILINQITQSKRY